MVEPYGPSEPWIGIDLGTCHSVVGYWNPRYNRVEILQNDNFPENITPSVVAFVNGTTQVG